jgi:hypothetical protein
MCLGRFSSAVDFLPAPDCFFPQLICILFLLIRHPDLPSVLPKAADSCSLRNSLFPLPHKKTASIFLFFQQVNY